MFFLYHKVSRPTGLKLAQALGLPYGYGVRRALRQGTNLSAILRWGNAMEIPGEDPGLTINNKRSIMIASDKLAAFTMMRNAGVRVPEFSRFVGDMGSDVVIGRTRRGARGEGIRVYQRHEFIRPDHELYVAYIPNRREYRLHVVGGEVIRVQGKYLDFPEQTGDGFIKNHAHGYRFRAPRQKLRPDREELAIKAVEALGLDFGAVDLIVADDAERTAYVLEVNTAPSCSPLTAAAYVGKLSAMIQDRTGEALTLNYNILNMLEGNEDEADTEEP